MKINKLFLPFILFLVVACFTACSSDDSGNDNTNNNNFDRSLMLVNWADNIIIPSYQNFVQKTNSLKQATDAFTTQSTSENLSALREAWESAYLSWQNVAMFDIGPAMGMNLRAFVNTYPTNTSNIDSYIDSGNYNLNDINLNDEQGFPALDYLLFGLAETDTQIIDFYDNDFDGQKYRQYLSDIVNRIDNLAIEVLNNWQSNYREVFIQNDGSSANSSTNRMANAFMEFYEVRLRNGKIGFPAGVFSGGTPDPSLVEAFYKRDFSKHLSLEALQAHQNFFNGNAVNTSASSESFATYLDFLNTIKEGENLSALINTQYNSTRNVINSLDDNFYQQINTNNAEMLEAFESLQDNVVYLKSDMFSALSITLDFESGDGD
jgi:predicted lipoprotein